MVVPSRLIVTFLCLSSSSFSLSSYFMSYVSSLLSFSLAFFLCCRVDCVLSLWHLIFFPTFYSFWVAFPTLAVTEAAINQ